MRVPLRFFMGRPSFRLPKRKRPPATRCGSSAVVGPSWRHLCRRRGGGEDPWLCAPGFGRVCLSRCRRSLVGKGNTPAVPGRQVATSRSSASRSEEHTSELQSRLHLVCRLLLEKKKKIKHTKHVSLDQRLTID